MACPETSSSTLGSVASYSPYRTFASDVASALGADRTVSVDDMNDMVDFEVSLANVCLIRAIT